MLLYLDGMGMRIIGMGLQHGNEDNSMRKGISYRNEVIGPS